MPKSDLDFIFGCDPKRIAYWKQKAIALEQRSLRRKLKNLVRRQRYAKTYLA